MFVPFQRTLRAQESDSVPRPVLYAGVGLLLLGAWSVWLTLARVPLFERSTHARVEVNNVGNAVEASMAGRLAFTHLLLGQRVEMGEVLAQLDVSLVELHLAEARSHHDSIAQQIEARRNQIAAEAVLGRRQIDRGHRAVDGARARSAEADARSRLATEEATRTAQMYQTRSISEMEDRRAQAEDEQKRASLQAARLEEIRLERQNESEDAESKVRIAKLQSEMTDLEGLEQTLAAAVRTLTRDVDQHTIRAPIGGRIEEIASKQVGAFVQAGDRLATIVPDSELRAVAEFDPASAVGRVRSGQSARLRLDGFPWMQYGTVSATVTRVGNEVRDGTVRVELALHRDPESLIPLQHGLPGSIEIEVDRVTPWQLIVRMAGKSVSAADERKNTVGAVF